jgi:quercetin dioxygenase-like cupin family protein
MKAASRRDVKRAIFGVGDKGASMVIYEGPLRHIRTGDEEPSANPGEAGEGVYLAWAAKGTQSGTEDFASEIPDFNLQLKPGETRFFRVEIPPGAQSPLHRTPYINDYFIALSGELTMYLQDGSACKIEAGDMFVQLATWHYWKNEGEEPFIMAGLMLGIETDADVPFGFEMAESVA